MQQLLAGPDRNVLAVGSGKEALRQILRTDFALILLDIRMPDMDGFEAATLIRKLKRSRHTPIIILTAVLEDAQSVFRGYEIGAVDRKSTRLNSSHGYISYAVFCLKKKNKKHVTM